MSNREAKRALKRISAVMKDLLLAEQELRDVLFPPDKNHFVLQAIRNRNMTFSSVKCNCGEVTFYKVPLLTLDDFECPRKPRKGKK